MAMGTGLNFPEGAINDKEKVTGQEASSLCSSYGNPSEKNIVFEIQVLLNLKVLKPAHDNKARTMCRVLSAKEVLEHWSRMEKELNFASFTAQVPAHWSQLPYVSSTGAGGCRAIHEDAGGQRKTLVRCTPNGPGRGMSESDKVGSCSCDMWLISQMDKDGDELPGNSG
ncbi:hypothetical protein DUI87_04566 [Hirundo rustica rustica]|uniref:Uncharacterized protein n=1 Tax=Hirundo rustica rustica TaxID=333673 RepID=A0A3M0L6L5_HIRRU|nr:hypothetical protein DUI87_04566 [Hirundo rustica rustica]